MWQVRLRHDRLAGSDDGTIEENHGTQIAYTVEGRNDV
jgi:hypothetical protein